MVKRKKMDRTGSFRSKQQRVHAEIATQVLSNLYGMSLEDAQEIWALSANGSNIISDGYSRLDQIFQEKFTVEGVPSIRGVFKKIGATLLEYVTSPQFAMFCERETTLEEVTNAYNSVNLGSLNLLAAQSSPKDRALFRSTFINDGIREVHRQNVNSCRFHDYDPEEQLGHIINLLDTAERIGVEGSEEGMMYFVGHVKKNAEERLDGRTQEEFERSRSFTGYREGQPFYADFGQEYEVLTEVVERVSLHEKNYKLLQSGDDVSIAKMFEEQLEYEWEKVVEQLIPQIATVREQGLSSRGLYSILSHVPVTEREEVLGRLVVSEEMSLTYNLLYDNLPTKLFAPILRGKVDTRVERTLNQMITESTDYVSSARFLLENRDALVGDERSEELFRILRTRTRGYVAVNKYLQEKDESRAQLYIDIGKADLEGAERKLLMRKVGDIPEGDLELIADGSSSQSRLGKLRSYSCKAKEIVFKNTPWRQKMREELDMKWSPDDIQALEDTYVILGGYADRLRVTWQRHEPKVLRRFVSDVIRMSGEDAYKAILSSDELFGLYIGQRGKRDFRAALREISFSDRENIPDEVRELLAPKTKDKCEPEKVEKCCVEQLAGKYDRLLLFGNPKIHPDSLARLTERVGIEDVRHVLFYTSRGSLKGTTPKDIITGNDLVVVLERHSKHAIDDMVVPIAKRTGATLYRTYANNMDRLATELLESPTIVGNFG